MITSNDVINAVGATLKECETTLEINAVKLFFIKIWEESKDPTLEIIARALADKKLTTDPNQR